MFGNIWKAFFHRRRLFLPRKVKERWHKRLISNLFDPFPRQYFPKMLPFSRRLKRERKNLNLLLVYFAVKWSTWIQTCTLFKMNVSSLVSIHLPRNTGAFSRSVFSQKINIWAFYRTWLRKKFGLRKMNIFTLIDGPFENKAPNDFNLK